MKTIVAALALIFATLCGIAAVTAPVPARSAEPEPICLSIEEASLALRFTFEALGIHAIGSQVAAGEKLVLQVILPGINAALLMVFSGGCFEAGTLVPLGTPTPAPDGRARAPPIGA